MSRRLDDLAMSELFSARAVSRGQPSSSSLEDGSGRGPRGRPTSRLTGPLTTPHDANAQQRRVGSAARGESSSVEAESSTAAGRAGEASSGATQATTGGTKMERPLVLGSADADRSGDAQTAGRAATSAPAPARTASIPASFRSAITGASGGQQVTDPTRKARSMERSSQST